MKMNHNLIKKILRRLGIALSPLIIATTLITILTIIGSIFLAKLPMRYYFPFITGGELQGFFDRGLLIIGIIIALFQNED